MSKLIWSSIGGAALAFAAPALAAGSNSMANSDSTSTPAQTRLRADQRHCVIERITGARVARKTCRTRREWLVEGMDPLIR